MVTMTLSTGLSVSAFSLSTLLLLFSTGNSFAFSRPAESASISLFFAGACLLVSSFLSSRLSRSNIDRTYREYIPLSDTRPPLSPSFPSDALEKLQKLTTAKIRKTYLLLQLAVTALCVRVEVYRQYVNHSHCSLGYGLIFLPVTLAAYEYAISQRKSVGASRLPDNIPKKPFNFIFPTLLLAIAGVLTASLKNGWKSTFICPLQGYDFGFTVSLEILGLLLDFALALVMGSLVNRSVSGADDSGWQTSTLWGSILLGAAVIGGMIQFITHNVLSSKRGLMIPSLPSSFFEHTLKQGILVASLCISASKAISHVTILTLIFIFCSSFTYYSLLSHIWTAALPFPTLDIPKALSAILILHCAGYLYLRSNLSPTSDGKRSPRLNVWLRCAILLSLGAFLTFVVSHNQDTNYHPISTLISSAKHEHQQWITKAGKSKDLKEAVAEYRKRFHQPPPPGFDIWYQYATNRSSLIIDDYDQIYEDLLPFQALSPKELRDLVKWMTDDQWNEVAAIIIRDGKAEPQAEMKPTHRWMIEGVARMVGPFVHHLPDMDVAFNINDECRVAVPWEDLESLKHTARTRVQSPDKKLSNSWSDNRTQSWSRNATGDQNSRQLFVDYSFAKVYDPIGRPTCPPKSKARTTYVWDTQALCTTCAQPHSLDQFVRNWKLSADICHQPDLAFLHGFFLSPASFKISQNLLPVFSQSKVSGFNDILYPSSWNYVDKVKYEPSDDHPDPPYAEKDPIAFWRGTTSEGKSEYGTWKGMVRQRLLHLANNHTSNHASVLLPGAKSGTFSYETFQGAEVGPSLDLKTSMYIAESVARCGQGDCDAQTREFGTVTRSDFQDHWKYRFLYDMDGAGFSGRFLSFLESRSLPFRTALFRQWLDSRITPWLHFVPQDLRLHDFFSTLAYFSGAKEVDAEGKVKKTIMKAHDKEGEWIAEEGRKWAEKAIRKEDMEIYMFRLLLEWARLTDDRRDELGFSI